MKSKIKTYFKYLKTIGVEEIDCTRVQLNVAKKGKHDIQKAMLADQADPTTRITIKPKMAEGRQLSGSEPSLSPTETANKLKLLSEEVSQCIKCALHKTRTQTVFGSGNIGATIMFVGEAPGADEDEQGLPFVGRAGQTLTKMIEAEKSLNMPRKDVYITNVLKCRPPGNRPPEPKEIEKCECYLKTQIALIRPRFICALGTHATQTLLKTNEPIGRLRGKWLKYEGIPLLATYHPSFLNRSPQYKEEAWKDMLTLKEAANGKN
jgi:uracil-DNA glycosylase family 4